MLPVDEYRKLAPRIGQEHLVSRLYQQDKYKARRLGHGRTFFHIENISGLQHVISFGLKCLGLYKRGLQNALDLRIEDHDLHIPNLPSAFEGYRILHLSDLHIDVKEDLADILIERLAHLEYDVCVMTGDFRSLTFGSMDSVLELLARITSHIKAPIYAVLGNHDEIEMVKPCEQIGIRFLLNENCRLDLGSDSLFLAGVDDAHYYNTCDVQKAADGIPDQASSILLSHSPELFKEAEDAGFNVYLCGHTHGGQICLPAGIPLLINARCPLRFAKSDWHYKGLRGFTSRGVGSTSLLMRFNCPPHVVVHRLTSGYTL